MAETGITVTFLGTACETLQELMRSTGRTADDLLGEALALEEKFIVARQRGDHLLVERRGRHYRIETEQGPASSP